MEETPIWLRIVKGLVLAFIATTMLLPFLNVVATSLSSARDVIEGGSTLFPRNPTLDSYRALLRGGTVLRSMYVSIGITVVGTIVQVTFTTMMAYGLSKPGVPGAKFFLWVVLGAFLFGPGLIPSYLLVKELGMIDTYQSLIIPGLIGAWNLIILRNFFQNLPQELLDAARVDGASDLGVLRHVVLPLSKAVIAVVALFTGVGLWNTFFNAILYLNDSTKWPIQVMLRQYVLEQSSITTSATLSCSTRLVNVDHPDGDRGRRDRADPARLSVPAEVLREGGADWRDQGVVRGPTARVERGITTRSMT